MIFKHHYRAVLGVNLGRNKDSASAAKDYCDGVRFWEGDGTGGSGNGLMISKSNCSDL